MTNPWYHLPSHPHLSAEGNENHMNWRGERSIRSLCPTHHYEKLPKFLHPLLWKSKASEFPPFLLGYSISPQHQPSHCQQDAPLETFFILICSPPLSPASVHSWTTLIKQIHTKKELQFRNKLCFFYPLWIKKSPTCQRKAESLWNLPFLNWSHCS